MNTFEMFKYIEISLFFFLENKDETTREKDVEVQKSSIVQNQQTSIRSTEEM